MTSGLIPYYFSNIAREAGRDISVGTYVKVLGLDRRFKVIDIFRQPGAVRLEDPEEGGVPDDFVPWDMVQTLPESDNNDRGKVYNSTPRPTWSPICPTNQETSNEFL